jgi:hypothetical protein
LATQYNTSLLGNRSGFNSLRALRAGLQKFKQMSSGSSKDFHKKKVFKGLQGFKR